MPVMAEKTSPPSAYRPSKTAQTAVPRRAIAKPAAAKQTPKAAGTPEGERIAKVLSRVGVASRREAERMIQLGEVSVNGKVIDSPALNVTSKDKITVRGELIGEPEEARLWLYYKPDGLVTSESDEKGRETVFDNLPPELPRVMSIGRLDLNSEGLLLLTNDGGLKRRLELPSTGWLRKYRVRVNGNPTDVHLEPLRKGIEIDGERFQPMSVVLDRIQGANAWLTVGLREGKNREIRRAMSAIDLTVNRLIRISYGPFRLGELQPGDVEEVRGKVLRDQLGQGPTEEDTGPKRTRAPRGTAKPSEGRVIRSEGSRGASKPKLRAGEGMKQLAQAFDEAVKPRRFGTAAAKTEAAKPAGRFADKPAGRPVAKSGAKPDARSSAKPGFSAKPGGKPGFGRPRRGE
jgi:23S rRNA pseudouridine2605 synthase